MASSGNWRDFGDRIGPSGLSRGLSRGVEDPVGGV